MTFGLYLSIYICIDRSIMHSSACGSTGCVDTKLIYHVDPLDVRMRGHTGLDVDVWMDGLDVDLLDRCGCVDILD